MKVSAFGFLCFTSFVCGIGAVNCPSGWTGFDESCYIVIKDHYTWFGAKTTCEALNGKLVEIQSYAENSFVSNMLRAYGVRACWLGLDDFAVEGRFVWSSSNTPAYFTNWHSGQPDNGRNSEDCGELLVSSGQWNDEQCETETNSVVCESREDPSSADY